VARGGRGTWGTEVGRGGGLAGVKRRTSPSSGLTKEGERVPSTEEGGGRKRLRGGEEGRGGMPGLASEWSVVGRSPVRGRGGSNSGSGGRGVGGARTVRGWVRESLLRVDEGGGAPRRSHRERTHLPVEGSGRGRPAGLTGASPRRGEWTSGMVQRETGRKLGMERLLGRWSRAGLMGDSEGGGGMGVWEGLLGWWSG